jgi:hypothetical protein
MKKNQCGFLIALIIVFLLNSILGCKASTEDNPETVDFPSSTAETIQTISEDTQLSDEKFIFDYELLSPYGQKKAKEYMPYLQTYLNSKPKDGYIFVYITFYYPDFDVEAEADKQLQTDYPELYEVLHHDAKNEPDLAVEDMAYRKRYELCLSIQDSYYRPIVLEYCDENDIVYVNQQTYGIITKTGNIYSIIENKAVESVGFENEQNYFGNPELDFDDDDLKKLLPDTQPFKFQPSMLSAHALNKIERSLLNELKYTPYNQTLDLYIKFYDSTNAKTKVLEKMKVDNPDFYDVYIRYVDSDGSIHTPSNQRDSDLLDSAIDYWFEYMNDIYEPFIKSKALEFCDESCIIKVYTFPACRVQVDLESIYSIANNPNVEWIEKYHEVMVS